MLCMDVALHKENHGSYVREKHIIHNQNIIIKELRKLNNGSITPPPEEDEDGNPVISSESDTTISSGRWNNDVFPWADYADVTSLPSSSRNTGKAPMNESDEDYNEDGGGGEEDEDEASE